MEPKGTCPECGREFHRAHTGRTRIWCSDHCKLTNWRRRHWGPRKTLGHDLITAMGLDPDLDVMRLLEETRPRV